MLDEVPGDLKVPVAHGFVNQNCKAVLRTIVRPLLVLVQSHDYCQVAFPRGKLDGLDGIAL